MLIISHRGNIGGANPNIENHPHHVMERIYEGYDVEVDVWLLPEGYFLGHDTPKYKVDYHFFVNKHLWVHCKNMEALTSLAHDDKINVFMHDKGIAITSKGYLFTAPGCPVMHLSVAVMPELHDGWDMSGAYAVCTDYPERHEHK